MSRPVNAITRRTVRGAIGLLAVAAIAVVLARPVLASHVLARVTVPNDVTVGEIIPVAVELRTADGTPLPGTTVIFYLRMSFAGTEGEGEIGRAATDETGVATLSYQPRAAGRHELRMEYVAPGDSTVEEVATAFVATGGEQLYRSAPGIDVPGLNVGLLMAVVTTVWSILFWVALQLVAIARAGGEARTPGRGGTR